MKSTRSNCSLAVEFSLVRENIAFQSEPITQLYVIQSKQNPLVWFGVLFVDCGIYMGAVLRFKMVIEDSYPDCPCPKIFFYPAPYHPLVNQETGELDTKNAFPDWSSHTHRLHQLLLFVKRVICQADMYIKQIQEIISNSRRTTEAKASTCDKINDDQQGSTRSQTSLNSDTDNNQTIGQSSFDENFLENTIDLFAKFHETLEIIKTYERAPEVFQRHVDDFRQRCCQQIFRGPDEFEDDANALLFCEWDPELHEPIRDLILAGRLTPSSLFASYNKETESVSFVPGSEPT